MPLGGARGGLVAEQRTGGRVATGGGPDGVGITPAEWTGGIVVVKMTMPCARGQV